MSKHWHIKILHKHRYVSAYITSQDTHVYIWSILRIYIQTNTYIHEYTQKHTCRYIYVHTWDIHTRITDMYTYTYTCTHTDIRNYTILVQAQSRPNIPGAKNAKPIRTSKRMKKLNQEWLNRVCGCIYRAFAFKFSSYCKGYKTQRESRNHQ